jgi:hypothetical protein
MFSEKPPHSDEELLKAIQASDTDKVANILSAINLFKGAPQLTSTLLKLGSGYMDKTLGHSISCTAFILLDYAKRAEAELWPAYTGLANYYCGGHFNKFPEVQLKNTSISSIEENILRAVSGTGIMNLHDTITLYSIERCKPLINDDDYHHLLGSWVEYLEDKEPEPYKISSNPKEVIDSYDSFLKLCKDKKTDQIIEASMDLIKTSDGKRGWGRFMLKALCELYDGRYDPHYLTGLGSLIWVMNRFQNDLKVVSTAMNQYLEFYFSRVG